MTSCVAESNVPATAPGRATTPEPEQLPCGFEQQQGKQLDRVAQPYQSQQRHSGEDAGDDSLEQGPVVAVADDLRPLHHSDADAHQQVRRRARGRGDRAAVPGGTAGHAQSVPDVWRGWSFEALLSGESGPAPESGERPAGSHRDERLPHRTLRRSRSVAARVGPRRRTSLQIQPGAAHGEPKRPMGARRCANGLPSIGAGTCNEKRSAAEPATSASPSMTMVAVQFVRERLQWSSPRSSDTSSELPSERKRMPFRKGIVRPLTALRPAHAAGREGPRHRGSGPRGPGARVGVRQR